MRHRLALVLCFPIVASTAGAQRRASDAGALTCDAARQRLRAELARSARERPVARWSTEPASRTTTGNTITTTQRLLYDRARAALLGSVSLLDSLTPLHGDLDEATLDEARPLLRARLRELALELERADGPRFEIMDASLATAASLVMRLGLVLCRGGAANDDAEARTLTAYAGIEEGVAMARRDWIAAGMPRLPPVATSPEVAATPTAAPTSSASRNAAGITDTLDAVVQSLEELQAALDAMPLAVEERDSIGVLGPGSQRVSLGDLLARVERFAADDAPRLLEAGGAADDLPLLTATSDTLRQLARALRIAPEGATPDDGSSDAQRALERLAQRLDALYRLLAAPSRP